MPIDASQFPPVLYGNQTAQTTLTAETPASYGSRDDLLHVGDLRKPDNAGMTTYPLAAGDDNFTRLYEVFGVGQTFSAAVLAVTSIGTVGAGAGQAVNVVAYLDDGTGRPLIGAPALLTSGPIDPSVSATERTVAISWTEPYLRYWLGYRYTNTTPPTTRPTLSAYTLVNRATDTIGSAGNAAARRGWTAATASLGSAITSISSDTATRAAVALRV